MTSRLSLALVCGVVFAPALRAGADPVTTATPTGDYHVAWLQLEKGGPRLDGKSAEPVDVPLFVGLRGGKAVSIWFSHPALSGQRIVWLDQSTVTVTDATLKGDLMGRTNLNWGSKNVHEYRYTLDAALAGDAVAGTFTGRFVDDAGVGVDLRGNLTGRLVSAEHLGTENALAAGKNWPHYFGDGFSLAGPDRGVKWIDDLANARPLWKSEAFIPTAYGSAPDSRYFDRAAMTDAGGGSSSPVVVDGRVFQFFYYPRGPVGLDKAYFPYSDEIDLATRIKERFPKREIQQKWVVNHFRTQADEVLVCLDATTGRTLWKTTFPQRGNNYQTHKHRGLFPVPLVADGVVYQPGTTGRLYAVDAKSGKIRWEYPDSDPEPYTTKQGGIDCHAPSPVLVGDTVIFAAGKGVIGVEAKSGKKRWEQPLWHRSSLVAWKGPTRPLVIATDRNHEKKESFLVALDPADGKVIWRERTEILTDYAFPLLAGDLLVGYSLRKENVKPGENDGLAVIHAIRLTEKSPESAWVTPPLAPVVDTVGLTIRQGTVSVSTADEVFCLDLATGRRRGSVKGVGGARTQTLSATDGRLLLQPEGRHGKQSFVLLDADPEHPRILGESPWLPPHSWTTAYANQPIVYPLVDGRLFVRGLDAVYCYDLRAR